jgi:DNA-binding transcriptional LysR family regulator
MANPEHNVAPSTTVDLNHVGVLIKVVEAGSFTAAARALGLPKSSVSRAVSRLERELGVVLLQRTTRKLALTEAGRVYVARAREALELLARAHEAVLDADHEPRGRVRLTATPDPSGRLLADPIAQFHARYPKIEIDVLLTPRRVDLVEEGVDLALRAGRVDDAQLVGRRIGVMPFQLFAAPSYLAARGTPRRLKDLTSHACVLFRAPRGEQRWTLQGRHRLESVQVAGTLNSDDLQFSTQLCVRGAGVALIPLELARDAVGTGDLLPVLPQYKLRTGAIYLLHPAARQLPRRVVLVRDFLYEVLRARLAEYAS